MPTFFYKAQDQYGTIQEGEMQAQTKSSLRGKIKHRGLRLIHIENVGENGSHWHRLIQWLRSITTVNTHEKITFARNLGLMLKAGLSLSRTLSVLQRQASNVRLKKVIGVINDDIGGGYQLYQALEKHPKIFSKLFISMVKAGEQSGNLAESLQTVAEQMDEAYRITKQVRGAMIYPAVIVLVMIAIGVLSMLFIVPTLEETFAGLGVELPLSTQIVIGISTFLREYWLFNIAGVTALLVVGGWYLRTRHGRHVIDFVLLHLPVVKGIVKQVNAARTARTLSSLLGSGVEYVLAIEITRDVVQNSYYKEVLAEAGKKVKQGQPFSSILAEHEDLYPVFIGEMSGVGEETGQIADMLRNTAEYYEEEVAQTTKNVSTIIEPMLMVLMGIGVGLFAISMLQPMYSLVGNI